MSWVRMRLRDELRGLPLWTLVTVANLGVMLGLDMAVALSHEATVPSWSLLLSGWIGIGAYLLVGARRERCRRLDLTLPLAARKMWWVHVVGRFVAVTVLAGIAAAAIGFVANRSAERVRWGGHPAIVFADLVAGGLLAALLLELQHPSLQRIPAGRRRALWAAVVVVTIPVLLALLAESRMAVAMVMLVVAVALAWGVHRVLPQGFLVQPDAAVEDGNAAIAALVASDGGATAKVPAPPSANGRILWRTLVGCLSGGSKDWFMLPAVVLGGAALAGLLAAWMGPDLEHLRVTYIPLASYMLFAAILTRLGRLHTLDPLPVSRRRMFVVLVLPPVALFGLGFVATVLGIARFGAHVELVDYRSWNDRQPPRVIVPDALLAFATADDVPEIGAPWGEAHTPQASPVFWGSRHVLYSPYDAPPGSSKRFVALQISRAAEAAYGVHVPYESIASSSLEEAADGRVVPRGGQLHLRAVRDDLHPRAGISYLAMLLFSVVVSWLLVVALLFTGYRAVVQQRIRQLAVTVYIVLFVAGMLGITALMVKHVLHPAAMNAALAVAGRHLDASPLGTIALWLAGSALTLATYGLAQRQFQRMEIPPRPTQYTLLDRMACET